MRLTDVSYGKLDGCLIKEVIETDAFKGMYLDITKSAPGSEDTYKKRIIEMYQAVNSIAKASFAKQVLFIGSQYPFNLWFSLLNGKFYKNVPNFSKIVMRVVPGQCCSKHQFPVKNCKDCIPMEVAIKNYDEE